MKNMESLKKLNRGQKAVIARLESADDIRRRLQDMGLIEGTSVKAEGSLTARVTARAGTKVGLSDPVV